jgi:hypothetical protein
MSPPPNAGPERDARLLERIGECACHEMKKDAKCLRCSVQAALQAERERALEDAARLVESAQHMPAAWNWLSLPGHVRALKGTK